MLSPLQLTSDEAVPEASRTYSIRELAQEFDLTTRAIRFYEDRGLLSPSRTGRQRVYAPRDAPGCC